MPISGSNRGYFKIDIQQSTIVGTIGNEIRENKAFVSFANSFCNAGLLVPRVLAVSSDFSCYLQEYIEGETLFDFLEKNRLDNGTPNNETVDLYKKVIAELPRFQREGA